jgi:hypothetical protein
LKKTIISNGFFALLLILSVNTFGQATYNSPYSRFGVGDLSGNNNPVISGMGGITAAFRDIAIVNHQNPASYTAFDTLSFVVNGGVSQRLSTWKSQTLSAQTEHSSLGYIRLGFPVTSRLKVSIGLNPYSNIGFNITSPQSLPDIGNFEYIYDGTGGLNSFYGGIGFKPAKGLSVGLNLSYMWGNLEYNNYSTFPDSAYYWSTKESEYTHVSDVRLNYGLQYESQLSENWSSVIGATFSNQTSLSSWKTTTTTMLLRSSDGIEYVGDTIRNASKSDGAITLPMNAALGLMFVNKNFFKFGIEYRMEQWSNYNYFGVADTLQDASRFAIGGEISPQHNVLSPYWKKMNYRFGFHYDAGILKINDTRINEYGMSFGIGLPVSQSYSSVNLGIEIGKRGTTNNNLISENYFKFTLGISLFERWFIQRKYQ